MRKSIRQWTGKQIVGTITMISFLLPIAVKAQQPLYKQATAPVEYRINDLLERMTIDEKVAQLCCPMGWEMYTKKGKNEVTVSDLFKERMKKAPLGALWAVLRADPWTQKTLETGLNPELAAKAINAIQRYAVEETRLGIPLLLAEECPHGHMAIGTTVFPTALLSASTWNKSLMTEVGEAIALEARLQGANIGLGPVLDIAREPRWSRVEETFGEDPRLTADMGVAMVKGLQGKVQNDGKHLYSTLKHFAAYGVPESGHNGARTNCGMRQLLTEYIPQFKQAVEEGVELIMTSYNAVDGVPCTSNKQLLTNTLRDEWGFKGVVISDLFSIEGIVGMRAAKDDKEAAAKSLTAGLDMDLGGNAFGNNLKTAYEEGKITIEELDRAVARVLRLKFQMGLFENPYVSPEQAKELVRSKEHKKLARRVAREGVVMLKNDDILPLSKELRRIAVIGPNADMPYNQLGDYTPPQERKEITTVLDGIRQAVSKQTEVTYVKGCAIRDTMLTDLPAAVSAATSADVVVLVVGGSSARDFETEYIHTGAATVSEKAQTLPDMDCGEGFDRSSLRLLGDQEKLLQAVAATGKPLVVIYIQGRPLNMNLAAEKAQALLTAWYPGEQGGAGIADVLFGDYAPAGRLPISIPRNEGQIPLFYSQDTHRDYVDGVGTPLYAFGYGLSYTHFTYSDLRMEKSDDIETLQTITCTITNSGACDGDEVVQLYIGDEEASVAQPPMLLKAFERISLKKGESKQVTFHLKKRDLALYDTDMHYVVEPGAFKVLVGAASDDIRLEGKFEL